MKKIPVEFESGGHQIRGVFYSAGGDQPSPTVLLLGGSDGIVRALDAATGAIRWTSYTGGAVRYPPSIADGRAFVGSNDGYVYAFVAANGEMLWRFRAMVSLVVTHSTYGFWCISAITMPPFFVIHRCPRPSSVVSTFLRETGNHHMEIRPYSATLRPASLDRAVPRLLLPPPL